MAKYLLAYLGGGMAETEEAQQKAMAAWGAWFGSLGSAVVDGGAPFGPSAAVGGGTATSALTGYSILQADSSGELEGLLANHPHRKMPGASIDTLEFVTLPGME